MSNECNNRVFITGLSALTACGDTAESTWDAVLAGQSGLDQINYWDISSWPSSIGGELKNFNPARMLPDRKLIKVISRQDVMGIHAAIKAVEDSQFLTYRENLPNQDIFNENTAIYVGSPGNKYFQQYDFLPLLAKTNGNMSEFAKHLFDEVHPMWLLRILPNNVLAYTGITYNFKGPNHNITNHAVGGTQAILEAFHAIKSGQAERAIVVAYDMGVEPQALFYYDKLGVISKKHLKPFDKEHDGTLLAEGAAAIVLESQASVQARDAFCYAEVLGGMAATEGAGLFSLTNDGSPLADLLVKTLESLNLAPAEIDLIVAHGNGNTKSDDTEAQAIKSVFDKYEVPVTAFKWAMGHTLCASGLIDAVLTTYSLKNRCIPGIANFSELAANCSSLNISKEHRLLQEQSPIAVMINRGFASMNACLVIKAHG
ncbi:3-oxoacyl-ACP synthase [Legionella busanensis]|uniref:3-oxoacyl-ACP synthase n=1 Tax=Legionella busanensis TaxID=190655 RepID=A0A378JGK0_9GAMM|nr:beta-ketoacyl synthase N-terminal-like domain-containing protein [Legionella busanensis]STX50295.1 3-oxoacyl-ACP synthase [Legionella busanensis]